MNDVVDVRSRSDEAERLTTTLLPTGMAPKTTGYRAVVVRSVPDGVDTLRYSGSIWKYRMRVEKLPIVAGLIGLNGSISPIAPPVPWARVLNWPLGKPNPCPLRFD